MGRFDNIEKKADYSAMERIGDSMQYDKLPMKRDVDNFKVRQELDTVTADILMNMCKNEPDGKKHVLKIFYKNKKGELKWMDVVMPKFRKYTKKFRDRKRYFEVIDCKDGKRKTFKRNMVKAVRKHIDKATGKWLLFKGMVDLR